MGRADKRWDKLLMCGCVRAFATPVPIPGAPVTCVTHGATRVWRPKREPRAGYKRPSRAKANPTGNNQHTKGRKLPAHQTHSEACRGC